MEKNMKKVFTLGILGMFMLMFSASFVLATEHKEGLVLIGDEVAEAVTSGDNPIGNWFTKWENADISPNIVKYLFWALVSMMVYSIALNIPGLSGLFRNGKEWLGAIFSIIVGFLSMAYITPDEIYAIMTNYSALGFVLGGALPFIILVAFTFTLGTDTTGGAGQRLANQAIAWVMWVAFLGFIGYKAFLGIGESSNWLTWVATGATLLVVTSLGTLLPKIRKSRKKAVIEAASEKEDLATAHTKAGAKATEELAK